jgi:phage tail sheath gpL-like
VNGEGGQAATLTIPTTVTLNNGANTLTLNTNNNAGVTSSGNITLSGALGAAGTKNVFIGGSIDVAAGAATGTYATTADFTITTTYN